MKERHVFVPLTRMIPRSAHSEPTRPLDRTPFLRRDEIQRLVAAYEPPQTFEYALEGEAAAYRNSGLIDIVPFVAWLVARGIGRIQQRME